MVKEWGFVHKPRTMDKAQRADFLIGYPFGFGAIVASIARYLALMGVGQ